MLCEGSPNSRTVLGQNHVVKLLCYMGVACTYIPFYLVFTGSDQVVLTLLKNFFRLLGLSQL